MKGLVHFNELRPLFVEVSHSQLISEKSNLPVPNSRGDWTI